MSTLGPTTTFFRRPLMTLGNLPNAFFSSFVALSLLCRWPHHVPLCRPLGQEMKSSSTPLTLPAAHFQYPLLCPPKPRPSTNGKDGIPSVSRLPASTSLLESVPELQRCSRDIVEISFGRPWTPKGHCCFWESTSSFVCFSPSHGCFFQHVCTTVPGAALRTHHVFNDACPVSLLALSKVPRKHQNPTKQKTKLNLEPGKRSWGFLCNVFFKLGGGVCERLCITGESSQVFHMLKKVQVAARAD